MFNQKFNVIQVASLNLAFLVILSSLLRLFYRSPDRGNVLNKIVQDLPRSKAIVLV